MDLNESNYKHAATSLTVLTWNTTSIQIFIALAYLEKQARLTVDGAIC